MMHGPTTKVTSKKIRVVWLPIVACPLGVVAGRYVGKYIFAALSHIAADPPLVRGSLCDNLTWGEIYLVQVPS